MIVQTYRELVIWQKAITLTKEIYSLTKKLPKEEIYALSNQMRRAAISIPSNIAEGQSRNSTKDFIRFLSIARGSKAELETQLLICQELNYLTELEIKPALEILSEIGKMSVSLMKKLSNN